MGSRYWRGWWLVGPYLERDCNPTLVAEEVVRRDDIG